MKKLIVCLCAVVGLQASDSSETRASPAWKKNPETTETVCKDLCRNQASIEGRVSYFGFSSNALSDVFGQGGPYYELTGTIPFTVWDLFVWVAADYFYKSGSVGGYKSTIQIVPGTFGFKYMRPICDFVPYLGAGLKWFWVDVHNHSSTVIQHISRNAPGGVVEAGCQYVFAKHFLIDVFFDYSFAWVDGPSSKAPNVLSTELNLCGWNLGGGVGYRF